MAWIVKLEIERKPIAGRRQPTDVVARVKVLEPAEEFASPIVQIDTFGSDERQNPGKQSQTLQLGREAAGELVVLLKDVYDLR